MQANNLRIYCDNISQLPDELYLSDSIRNSVQDISIGLNFDLKKYDQDSKNKLFRFLHSCSKICASLIAPDVSAHNTMEYIHRSPGNSQLKLSFYETFTLRNCQIFNKNS